MKSRGTEQFWERYASLPPGIKKQANQAYRLFLSNPDHPGLRFKRVHPTLPIFSARITRDYRALGVLHQKDIVWFWIGSHADYEALLKKMRRK